MQLRISPRWDESESRRKELHEEICWTFINANTAWHPVAIFDRDSIPLLCLTTSHRFLSLSPSLSPPLSLLSLYLSYVDTWILVLSPALTPLLVPSRPSLSPSMPSIDPSRLYRHFLFLLSVSLRRLRRLVSSAIVLFILSDSVYYISSQFKFSNFADDAWRYMKHRREFDCDSGFIISLSHTRWLVSISQFYLEDPLAVLRNRR